MVPGPARTAVCQAGRMTTVARRPLAVLTGLLLAACLGACTSTASDGKTPEEVMATAKQQLDETSGVTLTLSTQALPEGVAGLRSATGTATHAPAFDGSLEVSLAGQPVQVPVIATGGTVYAQLPFTSGWQQVDPARYQAPDPAGLIGEDGFSALLPATTGLREGESVRGGQDNAEVLTEFTGTVPGEQVSRVIPAAAGDSFDAVYQVDADGRLRTAALTGVFYEGKPELTYTLVLDDYGTTKDIVAP